MKRISSANEKPNSKFIRDLQCKFDENEKEGKKNYVESLNTMTSALMLVEVQEIIDRNKAAYQKRMITRYKK